MMASNILSRLLPSGSDDEEHARRRRQLDIEEAAGDDLDSEPHVEDQDLEQLLAEGMDDDMSIPRSSKPSVDRPVRTHSRTASHNVAQPASTLPDDDDDDDDDVPESLLLEDKTDRRRRRKSKSIKPQDELPIPMPVPGPANPRTRIQWETTRAQQQLHKDVPRQHRAAKPAPRSISSQTNITNPRQRAMWMWANVENLDGFLREVYYYFERHGIWSIILRRFISVFTALFVLWLSTFVFFCIDYTKLPGSSRLDQIQVPHCTRNLPFAWNLLIFGSILAAIYISVTFLRDVPRLWDMHNFYHHLLDIPDRDLQTVTWPYVISKLMLLRDANPNTALTISPANRKFINTQSKQRMDAHDIANRLMRRENFWISLVNKDMLNCTLDLPFFGKRHIYTRGLEWNISLCLMDFIFDESGQVKPQFLSSKKRKELAEVLRKRFFLAGLLNIVISIPLAIWAITMRFLGSFAEYYKNPSALSIRKFSPYAEWKIRDLNEVPHIFNKRKRLAYPYANRYLDQFPKDKFNQIAHGLAFVSGAFTAVLTIITMWDPDLFLGFEINGRTVLFWLSIFGTMFVTLRNAATDEDQDIWDPEIAMQAVIHNTHYCPSHWQGKLYTDEIRRDFTNLYKLEALLILEDIAGIIFTPMILMWSLPESALQLVDFFREFTVHIDGLGTVCSHALFNFSDGGKPLPRPGQEPGDLREDYYADKANKLMESYVSFIEQYGPNPKRNPHQSRKRHFNPPPTFPGIMNNSPSGIHDLTSSQRHPPSGLRHSMQQTPRLGPAHGHTTSPAHSILLDPHHQPRASPRQGPSRRGPRTGPTSSHHHVLEDDPNEAEEFEDNNPPDQGPSKPTVQRTSSNTPDDDSELGESWMLKNDEPDYGKKSGENAAPKVGVLGMLNEFTRPKTEGRGGLI